MRENRAFGCLGTAELPGLRGGARACIVWRGSDGDRPARVQTLFITPGSPWEEGSIESFNGKLRDELLDRELFDTLWEVKMFVECWRQTYCGIRPHSALRYRPLAPETVAPHCG